MALMEASRKLMAELASMVNKKVRVVLKNDRWYEGELLGFDHPSLNILLGDAKDNSGNKHRRVIVKGDNISEIIEVGIPLFDPEDFRDYLIKEMGLKEHQVKVIPEAGIVEVQRRYKVSEKGVEGSGPVAEILSQYFKQYIEERKKKIQG
jgi:small nuclear ribonucleoprotein (snRNP)-like protein